MSSQRGDHDQVDSLMQSLLSKIPKAATSNSSSEKKSSSSSTSKQTASNTATTGGKKVSGRDSKSDNNTLIGSDLDMREIELITKRLAQDLNTASFLSDDDEDDSDDDDLSDDEDDEEFRRQILREFSNVMNKDSESAADKVSKQSLKMLYLQLLSQGPSLLTSQDQADKFISKLSANEVRALTDLLQKSPDEILQFFNGDEMVKRAIDNQNTINLSSSMSGDSDELRRGLWKDLTSDDLLSMNDNTRGDASKNSLKDVPVAVREAVKAFENNALHYSQHPAALLQLCEKLSSHDQNIFLDILYREYTPERMEKLIEKEKKQKDASTNSTSSTAENQESPISFQFDGDLVAHVFKEVLTHFRMFKKYPHKFEPLLSKLNEQERQAFDSLVKAFWDLKLEQIKL